MAVYAVKLERSDLLQLPVHPDACTEETFEQWCAERVTNGARLAVDLFSGGGGLSLGLTNAGWTVAASVDHNKFALQTHRANFPGLALDVDLGDLKKRAALIRMLKRADIDLIAGGPPCQPFSRAGRSKIRSLVDAGVRDEFDERKELWRAYVDVVLKVKPRAVLMENVPDMALGDDFHVVRRMVDMLEDVGYRTNLRLVDAWQYGVPQHRKRLILLARLDSDTFTWPSPGKAVTVRDAIADLPGLGLTTGGRDLPYSPTGEVSEFAEEMRRGTDEKRVWDHMTRPVRDDDREIFALMTSKTLYAHIDPSLRRYTAETFDDKYKRLDWDELSRSITAHIAKDGYWYIHPSENRTLTVREAARIQTFPDDFRFAGTRSHAFQQIGNAVPPMLGKAAATALLPVPITDKARRNRWRALAGHLAAWAEERRAGNYWCVLPGDQLTPPVAAVVAMLDPLPVELAAYAPGLREVARKGRVTKRAVDLIEQAAVRRGAVAAVTRLRQLQDDRKLWLHPQDMPEVLALPPGKTVLLKLLAGDDVLLTSQPVIRVSSRVLNTRSERANSLTDGRVDLSRLVGGDAKAPLRMAALRLVGQLHCHKQAPMCEGCPLARQCATARDSEFSDRLF
ncbi:DNA cytosine methyltransferase [Actinosynnema pretiosum subsp. pretiosum]|uniref:Cytosine-specific methyltransferase n=1 Tax=Actinosynnema pretiosum subsp. pretiosum TaxID=103721 RepID=A0AA45LCF5_9PSEU|nr:Modification methylase [Actinosynnema pretiosum subsp. pretiosum]QUF06745.1 DNA cytosine methyltransferase [Actinosynnema pretiosum subsp. pretiosum]